MINQFDIGSGTGTAALLLAESLRVLNIEVEIAVINKKSSDSKFKRMSKQHIILKRKIFGRLEWLFFKFFNTTNRIPHSLNLYSELDIDAVNRSDCDLVHLHWIGANTISIEDLSKIKKPIVWTMHDSWAFCGAEHHPNVLENDNRFQVGYYRSNKPRSTHGPDICRWVYNRKLKSYAKLGVIHFIAPSKWECNMLKSSKLLGEYSCDVIHNIIDKKIFRVIGDKKTLKEQMNLPTDKIILGFGAGYDINDPNSIKGGKFLIEALQKLNNKERFEVVVFGPANEQFVNSLCLPVKNLGVITDPQKMAQIYNICDVFVCPSVIENLPYTCLEPICCGTPVAAFRTGGIPDIIEHKYNGYLAVPFDSSDLAAGIEYVLANRDELSRNSLFKVDKDFNNDVLVQQHIDVYNKILEENKAIINCN